MSGHRGGLVIIGNCGHKYGIPYTVQLRSSFGTTGVKVPGLLRGIPAIIWFGFQSWVGAGAINSCLSILFGFSNLPLVYALFTMLQVALAIKGFEGIKWLENISCVFIIAILAYMLYVVKTQFATEIDDVFSGIKGTWGMPFWAATTSFLGIYSTMIINASDYSRNLEEGGTHLYRKYLHGCHSACNAVYGTDRAACDGCYRQQRPGCGVLHNHGKQVPHSSDIAVYCICPGHNQCAEQYRSAILCTDGIIPHEMVPRHHPGRNPLGMLYAWKLVTDDSAAGLSLFTQFYSAFLGPIFAVMAVDYYILRKKKLNINHMYDKQGVFKGINWAAIIAIVIGSLCSLVIVQLSWYVSLIPTGLVYYFLMKNMKSAKSFRTGTIFQEQEG